MKKITVLILLLGSLWGESYTYLTWQKHNIHNHIVIHFFSPQKRFSSLFVDYNSGEKQQRKTFSESHIAFTDSVYIKSTSGKSIPRVKKKYLYVYHALLENLNPGSEYKFTIRDDSVNFLRSQQKFFVPPLHKLRIIAGGDMGYRSKDLVSILQYAAAKNPHLALIGGDIAYANGKKQNLKRWISWFSYWQENMITSSGHLIPMILAIGNHEVHNLLIFKQAPFYFGFFHQGGKPYFTRKLGQNTQLIVLDTDHIYSYSSQRNWLKKQLQKYQKSKFKIAMYHVPMYPAHREFNNSDSITARQLWLPLFDRYSLDLGLEHHDHVFKRTKRLKNNQVVKTGGTIYLGDGSFGRSPRSVTKHYYIEKASKTKHFWFLEINTNKIFIQAIDDAGKILDEFSLYEKRKNQ
ncbi:metallophosphoesterase [Candidatus Uabimicrobium sp. HlEnr_7]|uniref:metallophosphoesterase n=1 Tax=Candidatus Uabimicrobium helgolandensis TaxID=3095367 RepID=UPI00355803D8